MNETHSLESFLYFISFFFCGKLLRILIFIIFFRERNKIKEKKNKYKEKTVKFYVKSK